MNYIKKLSISLGITLLSLILLVFLATIFNYFNLINHKVMNVIILIIPIASLTFGGLYMGKKASKRGYLEGIKLGLIFSLFILIINLIIGETVNLKDFIFYLILIASSVFGSMVGINTKKS